MPHLVLDPYFIMLSVKQVLFFESLVWCDLGLNLSLPRPLVNTTHEANSPVGWIITLMKNSQKCLSHWWVKMYKLFLNSWIYLNCYQWFNVLFNLSCLFGFILWHINPCKIFNTKPYLIINICDLSVNSLWATLFLNEWELICLFTVKWFQLLLSNTNNSFQ